MGDSVDKFSVENRADEEIKIAVDNVVQCDYDKAVEHIQFSLKLLKSIGNIEKYVEYLNILEWYMSLRMTKDLHLTAIWKALPRQRLSDHAT